MMKGKTKNIRIYSLRKINPLDSYGDFDSKSPIEFLRDLETDMFLGNGDGINIYAARIDDRIGVFDRKRLDENNYETYIGESLETKKDPYDEPMSKKLPRIARKAEDEYNQEVMIAYKTPFVLYSLNWRKPKKSLWCLDV